MKRTFLYAAALTLVINVRNQPTCGPVGPETPHLKRLAMNPEHAHTEVLWSPSGDWDRISGNLRDLFGFAVRTDGNEHLLADLIFEEPSPTPELAKTLRVPASEQASHMDRPGVESRPGRPSPIL